MSQEKVDQYKKNKADRKKIMKREKRNRVMGITAAIVIFSAAVGWFGYAVYQNGKPEVTVNVETDYTAVDTYINGLTYE